MLSSIGSFGIPFPDFEGGFTPWDCQEPPFLFQQQEPVVCPTQTQEPVFSPKSVLHKPNRNQTSSDDSNRPVSVPDERKRRRMETNRESAKRSRLRKQKHLENLRNQVTWLSILNRELTNRVRFVSHQSQLVGQENEQLQWESGMLRQKLWGIRQVLLVREVQQQLYCSAWPCNNVTSINEQIPPPLIT